MSEPIDLAAAFDQIIAGLAEAFSDFRTVAAEDESRNELALPALILQISEIEPLLDEDAETGQLPALVRIELRVILAKRTPQVRRETVKAAAAVGAFVHKNRFGVRWGAAEISAIEPDEFSPAADQFDIWRVEWGHRADLGQTYFVDDGVVPTSVLVSSAPEIGEGNEPAYSEVAGNV